MSEASIIRAANAVHANMRDTTASLAKHLGQTVHESVLDRRLQGIQSEFPSPSAPTLEAWLTAWRALADAFPRRRPLRSPVLHWQRLAWPVMSSRGYNAQSWKLVQ